MTNKVDQTKLHAFRHLVTTASKQAPAIQAKLGGPKGPAPRTAATGYHAVTSKVGAPKD